VLADQIKSVDWRARGAVKMGVAPAMVLVEARAKINAVLGI
jgi:mRNA interferase MazF